MAPSAPVKVTQTPAEPTKGSRKVTQVVDDEEDGSEEEEYYEVEKILEKR